MTIPYSNIGMSNIASEFGGSQPHAISEYYRNGAYVPSGNTSIPSSGSISIGNFAGVTKYSPPVVNITSISYAGTSGGYNPNDFVQLYVTAYINTAAPQNYVVNFSYSNDGTNFSTTGLINTQATIYSGSSSTNPLNIYNKAANNIYWGTFYIRATISGVSTYTSSYGPIWV